MIRKVVLTADGSHTLEINEGAEHYHSMHGAVQEAEHVFIQSGLSHQFEKERELSVLEVGFGTGLNALLTFLWMKRAGGKLRYTGIEAFPVVEEEWTVLNYVEQIGPLGPEDKNTAERIWKQLHTSDWEQSIEIDNDLELRKNEVKVLGFFPDERFDVVYFDAFGPRHQPDMWTDEVFQQMAAVMVPGGVLVTYCAKGAVRRSMQAARFEVERLPGPPGKREMLRATKQLV